MLGITNNCIRRLFGVCAALHPFSSAHHVEFIKAFQDLTNFSNKDLRSILAPMPDCSPTFETFHRLQTLVDGKMKNGSFWFHFLDICSELDRPMLMKAVASFVAVEPLRHNKATVMKTLELLAAQSRFEEFRSLLRVLQSDLTAAEKVAFAFDLIKLLSQTPYYKEARDILPLLNERQRDGSLRAICEGAAKFDSAESALACLDDLEPYGHPPSRKFVTELFTKLIPEDGYHVLTKFLEILRMKHWIVSATSAKTIASWIDCQDTRVYTATMGVQIDGTLCSECKTKLPVLRLSEAALADISKKFYQMAFKGAKDEYLYLTTTPKELSTLEKFLESQDDRFDCVVDFLNVMHQLYIPFEPKVAGRLICEFLQSLKRQFNFQRFCLVCKGNPVIRNPNFLCQLKELGDRLGISIFSFITQNVSEDDLFTIYMALWSGPRCYLVSNDEFKQHRYIVGSQLGLQISRWQSVRQITYDLGKHGRLIAPLQCDTCVHGSSDNGWHVPYDDRSQKRSYNPSNQWLCIRPLHSIK